MVSHAYRVILLPEAIGDIDSITSYIKHHSPQNAAKVFDHLHAAARSLSHFPHRYEIHRSTRDPQRTVHSMAVPPFIVYYRIREQDRTVEVLTIRHGSRRQPRRFK